MSMLKFYIERAEECRRAAAATKLDNVRQRCLTAAQAWENMAERVRRTEAYRADGDARKAAEQTGIENGLCRPS